MLMLQTPWQSGSSQSETCTTEYLTSSSEVKVAWNFSLEFSKATAKLLEEALERNCEERTQKGSARFYVSSKLRFSSSTTSKFMNQQSRIDLFQ